MIRVVIVDDSAFMRKAIGNLLAKDPEIEIAGTATNGLEALEVIKKLDPDVVTMDIEMPKMDGITALSRVMSEMPRPVLMISSLTTEGADVTLRAMEIGAVDFIAKPSSTVSLGMLDLEAELQQKVKAVAGRRKFMRAPVKPRPVAPGAGSLAGAPTATVSPNVSRPTGLRQTRDIVAIGVSTGGPPAVQKVLAALPADFPAPILIAQHMPAAFTGPFAQRLNNLCQIAVKEAEDGEKLRDGCAYVCPGGKHMTIEAKLSNRSIRISEEPKSALYKPSANELIGSVGEKTGNRSLGIVLTGMGSDGLEGARVMKAKGGRLLAQSEASCVVYGMPKAIVDAGLADEILDINDVARAIMANLYK